MLVTPTFVGAARLEVKLSGAHVLGSPFAVTVAAGAHDPASTTDDNLVQGWTAGVEQFFTRDEFARRAVRPAARRTLERWRTNKNPMMGTSRHSSMRAISPAKPAARNAASVIAGCASARSLPRVPRTILSIR